MSSVLMQLLDPYRLLVLSLVAVIVLLWRRRREPVSRLVPATISVAALAVLSTPAVSHFSLGTLEWQYPPAGSRPDDAEAIVVLGGGLRPADAVRLHAEMNADTLVRCLHAAAVYRQGKPRPVIVCGGRIAPGASTPALADLMRDFLRDQGVRESDLIVEVRSRTTYENAVECRKLLERQRIGKVVLVTDALHMSRALGCFRKQGIAAVPSACRHEATEFEWAVWDFLPSAGAVRNHERTCHEWLGSAWYWFKGYL